MSCAFRPMKISLGEWDAHYATLSAAGATQPRYGGPLSRHLADGNLRLEALRFDNSGASLRLWNFLLTEEQRLHEARRDGKMIVGTMKDLGTIPVMVYSLPGAVAFYPDGAWWTPCIMQKSDGLLEIADSMGIDEAFCPVRAMLGAFIAGNRFPIPDLLICSAGATCDDFSAIAQRLEQLGHRIEWWEIPPRRSSVSGCRQAQLPGGFTADSRHVDCVRRELGRLRTVLELRSGCTLDDSALARGIAAANRVRRLLAQLRRTVFTADPCPLPALEMLIAEMLAIHYCSDRDETEAVLADLLEEVHSRISSRQGVLRAGAARIFYVNPVADLRVMNLIEESGARVCGTEYMFCHALDPIPDNLPPLEALARMALADPMVGPAEDRARRICEDIRHLEAEGVVVSRIPGASHCAYEGEAIRNVVHRETGLPVIEIEVPPVSDATLPTVRTRLEALVETVRERRRG